MWTRTFAVLTLAAAGILLSGCAIGNEYAFDKVAPSLSTKGSGQLAVATVDRRADVVSGENSPNYVGEQRAGFGIPYDVTTDSDRPFADEWTDAVCRALRQSGYDPAANYLPAGATDADAVAALAKSSTGKSILVVLNKWDTDTYNKCELNFDVTFRVLEPSGAVLATKAISGKADLGGSAWNPPAHARKAVPEAFGKQIEELLSAPEIASALKQNGFD